MLEPRPRDRHAQTMLPEAKPLVMKEDAEVNLATGAEISSVALKATNANPRQRILEAALNCFARFGFHASSMQEICAEAQMSPGALYRHFPSKDAIIEAIAEIERDRNRQIMAHLDHEHADILEAIFDTGFAYLKEVSAKPAASLCAEVMVEAHRNERIRAIFDRNNCEGRTALHNALARAQAKGQVDEGLDLDVVTAMFMALGDGLILRGPFEPDMPFERMDPVLRQLLRRMLTTTHATASETKLSSDHE
jgi:TetR/AcrR family transcriptional regulator, repressor for uid operon